jgi:hypothetical protein
MMNPGEGQVGEVWVVTVTCGRLEGWSATNIPMMSSEGSFYCYLRKAGELVSNKDTNDESRREPGRGGMGSYSYLWKAGGLVCHKYPNDELRGQFLLLPEEGWRAGQQQRYQ